MAARALKKTPPIKPQRSKFMGHNFRIKWVPKVEVDGTESYGCCDTDSATIKIQTELLPAKERATLLHEMCHQIFDNFTVMPAGLEEPLIEYLGEALAAHIEQNPLFWRYVTRRIKS